MTNIISMRSVILTIFISLCIDDGFDQELHLNSHRRINESNFETYGACVDNSKENEIEMVANMPPHRILNTQIDRHDDQLE